MSQQILNTVSAVFSFLVFVFFIVGCVGYASTELDTKNVAWFRSNNNGFRTWFGLQQYVVKDKDAVTGYTAHGLYADEHQCGFDFCNACAVSGNAAFGLLVIATIFSTFTAALSGVNATASNFTTQLVNLFCAFVSGTTSLIGFALFMTDCMFKVSHETTDDLKYGPGSIITLLGLLMMWIVVLMQVGAVALGK
jgi:hypothetical protein